MHLTCSGDEVCCARSDLAGGMDLKPMSLGLSHSLSRYKLKFSPEKVRQPSCRMHREDHSSMALLNISCIVICCWAASALFGWYMHIDTDRGRLQQQRAEFKGLTCGMCRSTP